MANNYRADFNTGRRLWAEIFFYVVLILVVNIIFLYLDKQGKVMICGHIFFGTVQLIYVVPKIIANISKIKNDNNA